MESKNGGLKNVFPLQKGDFQVPCQCSFPMAGIAIETHEQTNMQRLQRVPCDRFFRFCNNKSILKGEKQNQQTSILGSFHGLLKHILLVVGDHF